MVSANDLQRPGLAASLAMIAPPEAVPRRGVLREERRTSIKCLIDMVRNHPAQEFVKLAASRIATMLEREFPPDRYDSIIGENLLEPQLRQGISEGTSVVIAFVERAVNSGKLWSWTAQLVEIAGVGATIDEMVATIRSPDSGPWQTRRRLDPPLRLEAFGSVEHTWSCLSGPWQGGTVKFSYTGYSCGRKGSFLVVRSPEQYPG
jgi:hypothetical protein